MRVDNLHDRRRDKLNDYCETMVTPQICVLYVLLNSCEK